MNFWEKSENVMFSHSLRISFMQKIRKIYHAVFRENKVRQRERQRERDGPEYKGPPDAIAKPSDQKNYYFNFKEKFSQPPTSISAHAVKLNVTLDRKCGKKFL